MFQFCRFFIFFALLVSSLLYGARLCADTIYLKNGHQIDGMVTGRHEGFILLRIGNVGNMKIAEDQVKKIEKNARTGYLDPSKGRKKPKQIPKVTGTGKDPKKPVTQVKGDEGEKSNSGQPEILEDKLDPEVEKKIQELIDELKKQRSRRRVRAERKLNSFGALAVPQLIKVSQHPFELTRTAVFRLFKRAEDFRSADACIEGLSDPSEFVRKLAWETLRAISGKTFPYSWKNEKERSRAKGLKRWKDWVDEEKAKREKEKKKK